ncbi:hypothetical protein K493DRAFT_319708 [Basidiobolus meristosporus CBS 931.73]|uniref:Uncharacterized protein n=1 Tax=Basidiobolus meristosporus CBS 931.73 TaxID=1314790 RepID=A0A1Y1XN77_9FUNG|nr:hypothetical protein K493DRAFT_319708 [Basidiobolus meristosporus CBS 931.73]|eukprot:ORX87182.1 hypothetical protein K493DRAFT_319708 [Basidiobolus meristosporus CBS 931.73]
MMHKSIALLLVCAILGVSHSAPVLVDDSGDMAGVGLMKRGKLSESEELDTISEINYSNSLIGRVVGVTRTSVDGLLDLLGIKGTGGLDSMGISNILNDPAKLQQVKEIAQKWIASQNQKSSNPTNPQPLSSLLSTLLKKERS